jgi:hypothetical protein
MVQLRRALTDCIVLGTARAPVDVALTFPTSFTDLSATVPRTAGALTPHGLLWAFWPKKSSGEPTDLSEARCASSD